MPSRHLRIGTRGSPMALRQTALVRDYRIEGPGRYKTMTLPTHEFIRRFLTHVLPKGLHRTTEPLRSRACAMMSLPL